VSGRVWALGAIFLAGLGLVIGSRMSTEAMAVVVGVVLGVAAAIPMALLVLLFVGRNDKREERQEREQPPVVILAPGEYWTRERRPGQLVTHNGSQCIVGADGGLYPLLPTERR
jgi:hypothetical protein